MTRGRQAIRPALRLAGQPISAADLAARCDVDVSAIYRRLRDGETPAQILAEPKRRAGYTPNAPRPVCTINDEPFALDPVAQAFVRKHPDGATLEEVGEAFGVSRERIRQIEEQALRHLRMRIALGFGDLVR